MLSPHPRHLQRRAHGHKDEVALVNTMIQGILDLIAWEKELEAKAKA